MTDETATASEATQDGDPEPEAPRDELRESLLAELTDALGDAVVASHVEAGRDLWVRVAAPAWSETAELVRYRLGARYFGFLSAIDWLPSPFGRSMTSAVDEALDEAGNQGADAAAANAPAEQDTGLDPDADAGGAKAMQHGVTGGDTRFQVFARVAHVGEPGNHWGLTLKADIDDDELSIGTWTRVYAGADWHERETWEMFGITFVGHPGLRHMYLPGDFEGNPLRKDFPLLARMVKPWPGIVDVEPLPQLPDDGPTSGSDSSGDPSAAQPGEGSP